MPLYDQRNGKDMSSDRHMAELTRVYANGTARETISPADAAEYGTRMRASVRPSTIVGGSSVKQAFEYEAPVRDSRLGAFKEVNMGFRGRSKSAYNILTGKGVKSAKRMVLTAPDSGYPVEGMGDYVTLPREGLGSYVTVPEGAATIGQATVPAESLWRRDLDDFSKDIRGMHAFTTGSQEIRFYQKGVALVANGRNIFATNPQMLAAIAPIAAELDRWRNHRAWALTRAEGTDNRVSIGKVQGRMITALNYARVAMGIAAIPSGSIIPENIIPGGQLPNVPGAPGTPMPPAPTAPVAATSAEKALAKPSWLEKNKLLVGGALVTILVGGYVWFKRQG